jgi:hypothetical protein
MRGDMMREPMAPLQPAATMAPSARLAASHDALANYLRGYDGSAANGHTQGAQGMKGPAGGPAATPPINANLALVLANSALAPLARDHPWALVGGAAAAGALLAARPWRKVLRPLLVAGMVSPVVTRWAAHALTQNLARRWLGPDPGQPR